MSKFSKVILPLLFYYILILSVLPRLFIPFMCLVEICIKMFYCAYFSNSAFSHILNMKSGIKGIFIHTEFGNNYKLVLKLFIYFFACLDLRSLWRKYYLCRLNCKRCSIYRHCIVIVT